MEIKTLVVGELSTNCYLVNINHHHYIIDPGGDLELIKKNAPENITGILVTHHHFDHVGALKDLEAYYHIKHNTNILDFEVIETKGHTDDSITFYNKENQVMFCGDFLFNNGVGRTDLGGNDQDLKISLTLISSYPDDIKLYPGHGPSTLLGTEKEHFKFY